MNERIIGHSNICSSVHDYRIKFLTLKSTILALKEHVQNIEERLLRPKQAVITRL